MRYSTLLVSALAATGAIAAPARNPKTKGSLTVILEDPSQELATQTQFTEGKRQTKPPVGSSGPFTTVQLSLDANVVQKDIRCQVLDDKKQPIVLVRGQSVDVTFSDADKGPWTFKAGSSKVSSIICDPAFKKAEPTTASNTGNSTVDAINGSKDTDIRVTLTDGDLATQTAFGDAGLQREVQNPTGSSGPYNSVALSLGADVQNQDLRCQVLDKNGKPITVKRGESVDTTFSDAKKGPWSFLNPASSEVDKIVCDPAFVKAAA
jgi:hypothetical protein